MKFIVGLGNPGKKYEGTRHNVGFMVLDRLIGTGEWRESKKGKLVYRWARFDGKEVELVKPLTFMNKSGEAVAYVKRKHPDMDFNDLYVVHDDLDIVLSKFKLQKGRGPREHNGLQSIYERLGGRDFWHVRVGIENRSGEDKKIPGEAYVLQKFTDVEKETIEKAAGRVVIRLKEEIVHSHGD